MISIKFRDQDLHIGDTVKVKSTVIEGGRSRVQIFEGLLLAIRGRAENRTITVRRIGPAEIGVERIWPLNSRQIVDIVVSRKPKKVRRSKLYYLRGLTGRMATRV